MEFSESWNYFFENHGRCPVCKNELCPQVGCTYKFCPMVTRYTEAVVKGNIQWQLINHFKRLQLYRDMYKWQLTQIRKRVAQKNMGNLDKAVKKTYIIDNEL